MQRRLHAVWVNAFTKKDGTKLPITEAWRSVAPNLDLSMPCEGSATYASVRGDPDAVTRIARIPEFRTVEYSIGSAPAVFLECLESPNARFEGEYSAEVWGAIADPDTWAATLFRVGLLLWDFGPGGSPRPIGWHFVLSEDAKKEGIRIGEPWELPWLVWGKFSEKDTKASTSVWGRFPEKDTKASTSVWGKLPEKDTKASETWQVGEKDLKVVYESEKKCPEKYPKVAHGGETKSPQKDLKVTQHIVDDFETAPIYRPVADFVTGFTPSKRCSEYLIEDAAQVLDECPQLPVIVAESMKIAGSMIDLKVDALDYLTPQELFAIVVWSFDLCMVDPDLPGKANFYFQCNRVLQLRDHRIARLKGYLHFMHSGLGKMPDQKMEVFRGLKAASMPTVKKYYSTGQKVHWSGFSSTTTDFNVACEFAESDGIVLKLKILSGKQLGSASALPREAEILLMPNFAAVVTSEMYRDPASGILSIDLVELAKTMTHVF